MRLSLILEGSSVVPLDILQVVADKVGPEADFRFFCLDGGGVGNELCTWVANLEVGGIPTSVTGVINSKICEVVAVKPPLC